MADTYGYTGKMLRVNLTTGAITTESDAKYLPEWLGSKGLLTKLYWDEIGPEVGALEPENKLMFANGPLNGTGAVSSAKGSCGGKSPVFYPVNTFSYSNTASYFPNELKRAGYDAVIIEGKAEYPVYLYIHNDKVEIREARDLWGKSTSRTRQMLWGKLGKQMKIACIGPAGENLVNMAVITVENNAVYGRGGFGAVMGSKNLKAIACYGTNRIPVADPKKLMEHNLNRVYGQYLAPGEKRTVNGVEVTGPEVNEIDHFSPAGNIRTDTQLKEWARLGLAAIKPGGCEGCYIHCRMKRTFFDQKLPSSSYTCASGIGWTGAIQQENAKRGIIEDKDGYEAIHYSNLVDDMGMNVNVLSSIATYMGSDGKLLGKSDIEDNASGCLEASLMYADWIYACYQHGIFNDENTGLPFSEICTNKFFEKLIRKISYREGFGDVLANGFRYAAQYVYEHPETFPNNEMALKLYRRIEIRLGNMGHLECGHGQYLPNSSRALFTVMQDRAGSEPEYMFSGMGHYPNSESSEYNNKWYGEDCEDAKDHRAYTQGVVNSVIRWEEMCNVMDSAHMCSFMNKLAVNYRDKTDQLKYTPNGVLEALTAIWGREVTLDELYEKADRISQLTRAIYVRDGMTTYDDGFWGCEVDELNDFAFDGLSSIDQQPFMDREGWKQLKSLYYKTRGWVDGVPTRATLEKYDLKDVADVLDKKGLLKG